jgi:hypothetical protein
MIKLEKAVHRETGRSYKTAQGRPLIVTLAPGDMVFFRQKGCRKTWVTTIESCFMLAVWAEINAGKKKQVGRTKNENHKRNEGGVGEVGSGVGDNGVGGVCRRGSKDGGEGG